MSPIFMPWGGLQFGVIYLLKSGSSQAKKLEGLGFLLLDYYISNGWLPGPEEKTFLGRKMASGWEKSYTAKEQRKNL